MENLKVDESSFAQIPDEILEKIIKYVPASSRKNCFLVSRRFKQEAIKATWNLWVMRLNEKTVSKMR